MASKKSIKLITEIPGPKSRAIVARREAATPQGAAKLTQIAVASVWSSFTRPQTKIKSPV